MEGEWKEGERRETTKELHTHTEAGCLAAILSHNSDLSKQENVCLSNPQVFCLLGTFCGRYNHSKQRDNKKEGKK